MLESLERIYNDEYVMKAAQEDFQAVLRTCQNELSEEFVKYLGEDYDLSLLSLHLHSVLFHRNASILYHPQKYLLSYNFIVKYRGEDKYHYILKLWDDYELFDNVFYPIRPDTVFGD